jgi:hypothetical protein
VEDQVEDINLVLQLQEHLLTVEVEVMDNLEELDLLV